MPFDALAMAALADELSTALPGGQVQKIIQPSANSIALAVYAQGSQRWLVASADPRYARVSQVSGKLAKAFPTPSPFVMLLRKYLEGARVRDVTVPRYERILEVTFAAGEEEYVLVVEVMGKHSNVLLLSSERIILGALKVVHPKQSRVRPVRPGQPYERPPFRGRDVELFGEGGRVDPTVDLAAFTALLGQAPPETPLGKALQGLLPGAGPFLATQIAVKAGYGPQTEAGALEVQPVAQAAQDLYSLPSTHAWRPTVFTDAKGRLDYAPYEPAGVREPSPTAGMSAAIEQIAGEEEGHDALATLRGALLADIERARRRVSGRIHSLQEGLRSSGDADDLMQQGQLLLAYGHTLSPRADLLEIPELDTRIELDPRMTPAENAERMFRRYRKLKDAARRIPGMLASAAEELERFDETATFARLAGSEADLESLRRELTKEDKAAPAKKQNTRRGPPRYRLDGLTAVVGRSAKENEEVTFRIARGEDAWLHARGRTGAHVIIPGGGKGLSDEQLSAAAELAAYFSEGREDTAVDVVVAAVRDVRKVPKGAPGKVTYRNARTVRVKPGIDKWARI
jgi:predicted ribosome quality control (RQC) complex YloA/Tae2 family protein